jgi:hypothetical protein
MHTVEAHYTNAGSANRKGKGKKTHNINGGTATVGTSLHAWKVNA